MTKASDGRQSLPWTWCVPGVDSPLAPIMLLCMMRDGRRLLPTSVIPSMATRSAIAGRDRYAELKASPQDLALAKSVSNWHLNCRCAFPRSRRDLTFENEFDAQTISVDVAAAARFLAPIGLEAKRSVQPVAPSDLRLGRTVLLRVTGESELLSMGWLAGISDLCDVVRESRSTDGYERLRLPSDCLGEDGSNEFLLARRGRLAERNSRLSVWSPRQRAELRVMARSAIGQLNRKERGV